MELRVSGRCEERRSQGGLKGFWSAHGVDVAAAGGARTDSVKMLSLGWKRNSEVQRRNRCWRTRAESDLGTSSRAVRRVGVIRLCAKQLFLVGIDHSHEYDLKCSNSRIKK